MVIKTINFDINWGIFLKLTVYPLCHVGPKHDNLTSSKCLITAGELCNEKD